MICQGCYRFSPVALCEACFSDLRPAPDRLLPGGIRAISGFDHTGVAARLVHSFKYRGNDLVVALAVAALAERIDSSLAFVPIPRVWSRFLRYGVDPAARLAAGLARATGGEMIRCIRRPIHSRRRAGSEHRPAPISFALGLKPGCPIVIVDDVLTTGATVIEAVRALVPAETRLVVTATSARQVSSLLVPVDDGPARA